MRAARHIDAMNLTLVTLNPGQKNDQAYNRITDIFLKTPDEVRPLVIREACKQAVALQEANHIDFITSAAIHTRALHALAEYDPDQSKEIMLYLCDFINPLTQSEIIKDAFNQIPDHALIKITPDVVHNLQDRIEKTAPPTLPGLHTRHNYILAELALEMIEKLPESTRLQETRDFIGWLQAQTKDKRFDVQDQAELHTRAENYIISNSPEGLNTPRPASGN